MEWKFYNQAVVPIAQPHECACEPVPAEELFAKFKNALFIKYISAYDLPYPTNWWYMIKDDGFDITALKAKRRNVINNGIKNFEVREIDMLRYIDDIYEIICDANEGYSTKITVTHDQIAEKCQIISGLENSRVLGAFYRDENTQSEKLCGYLWVEENKKCISMVEQKCIRKYERLQINAALVYGLIEIYKERMEDGIYLCDGERTVVHQSAFQDYLVKYFGFRKAYCTLKIIYRPFVGRMMKILFPLRRLICFVAKVVSRGLYYKVCGIFKMEEIARSCRK